MNDKYEIIHGECIEAMSKMPANSIDLILCDPPYEVTAAKWDTAIPFETMWPALNRVAKTKTPIVLFGTNPFHAALIMSNLKRYKYDWIWEKNAPTNFLATNYQPMRIFENICVFASSSVSPNYYPIMTELDEPYISHGVGKSSTLYRPLKDRPAKEITHSMPNNMLKFDKNNLKLHPTEKPVDLLKYLVETYTKEGDVVLDFTMGSGSTGEAALALDRKFIGIELDEGYFKVARDRLNPMGPLGQLMGG